MSQTPSQGATAAVVVAAVLLLLFVFGSNTVTGITQSIINALSFTFSTIRCFAISTTGGVC